MASFKNDKLSLKLMIAFMICFETVHSVSLWIYLYRSTVFDIQNTPTSIIFTWDLRISVISAAIISFTAQVFYSYRVLLVSKIPYYSAVFTILAIFQFGSLAALVLLQPTENDDGTFSQTLWMIILNCALGAFIDLSNAVALCVLLKTKQGSIGSTNQLVNKLILWTIETGLLTSICNILQLVLLVTLRGSGTSPWFFFFIQSAKLYGNVILASLNGRISLRTAQAKSHILPSSIGERGNRPTPNPNQIEIRIEMNVDRVVTRSDSPSGVVVANKDTDVRGPSQHALE
ncbi:hypothetical protein K435DRAFT_110716 [Dendrothele bispora CBS 962.96]|uniref:DUF6534 domain-containing protein n=1 Tax=Dendrothele bispora (strain CBS 962.96) TaxID=1314807 RepID=A0A4S8M253_DENBC|nr:hypothetical protein K435DRAFT_110716 [Dendrothele bispora CBS 962.96]